MRVLVPTVLVIFASVLTALVIVDHSRAGPAESVACSSTLPPGRFDLSGEWTVPVPLSPYRYRIKQKGSCVWWAGGKSGVNVFFGSVLGSSVTGVWADLLTGANGTVTFSVSTSGKTLFRRSSTGGFPARILRRTP